MKTLEFKSRTKSNYHAKTTLFRYYEITISLTWEVVEWLGVGDEAVRLLRLLLVDLAGVAAEQVNSRIPIVVDQVVHMGLIRVT